MIGKTLAHYEITSRLGKGGKGEVGKAWDMRLGGIMTTKEIQEQRRMKLHREA